MIILHKRLPTIYKIGIFLAFLVSLNPWFFVNRQTAIIFLSGICVCTGICLSRRSFVFGRTASLQCFLLLLFYISISLSLNAFGLISQALMFIIIATLLCLNDDDKIGVLQYVTMGMAIITAISLTAFLTIFIIGIDLPYTVGTYLNYTLRNYLFFLKLDGEPVFLLPRFQSIFLEPGHYGMIVAFLLYVQKFNLKHWYNLVLFIGALLSMSLASYVLMLIGILFRIWATKKSLIILFAMMCGVVVLVFNNINGGDNMVKTLILDRLKIENGQIAGNNRFTQDYEREFAQKSKTTEVIFGWQPHESGDFKANAGYKVYIGDYGLVGLFFCILCYFGFCNGYQTQQAILLFLLYAAAFLQRAYPFWMSELIIFICGIPYLCRKVGNQRTYYLEFR